MYNVYKIWGCLCEGETVILFPVQMSAQPLGLTPNPEADNRAVKGVLDAGLPGFIFFLPLGCMSLRCSPPLFPHL